MIQTVYVIHHSHTDIGYTHGQGRITRWHEAYLREAMRIAAEHRDFAWTCETFFAVERFWQSASAAEREQFLKLARAGQMGVTGGFFHLTELPDLPLLRSLAGRANAFAESTGLSITSAMQADINGCSLVNARALAEWGIQFLLSCVHPHHGYVPLGKRQELFRWDLGDHRQLIVCHGDHYHTGNELGLAPGTAFNYLAGFTDEPAQFDDEVLERRLPIYLKRVQDSGWSHPFVVVAVSGLCTDNAPPSDAVRARIARWNEKHGSDVQIEMTTPGRLSAMIQASNLSLPTFTGDWPDWWADGVAGDPEAVAIFRRAQRDRDWLRSISTRLPKQLPRLEQLDESLALFAEHTFGHSASVSWPWNPQAHQLRLKKLGFAADSADLAEELFDEATDQLGGGALSYDRPPIFRIINTSPLPIHDLIELQLDSYDSRRWLLDEPICVKLLSTGKTVRHQLLPAMRGTLVLVEVSLDPGESLDLQIERDDRPATFSHVRVPDLTRDLRINPADVPPTSIVTDHVEITWRSPEGIFSWRDRANDRSLLNPKPSFPPFTLRASRLPAEKNGDAQCDIRRKLGRNRNCLAAEWSASTLNRVHSGQSAEHLQTVLLDYSMPGFELLQVRLDARLRQPRVDVEVIMHKLGTWDAENIYLSLPFSAGEESEIWLDRGVPIQPVTEQLPGTLTDYYGVQDGLGWYAPKYGVTVAQHDAHLIQLGPLCYGVRDLAGEQTSRRPCSEVYAWLMTNYWETNFSPELSGFYSFRFSVLWGEALADRHAAFAACRSATRPLRAFRLGSPG